MDEHGAVRLTMGMGIEKASAGNQCNCNGAMTKLKVAVAIRGWK
jgi:hypothetical protein